MSWPWSSLLSPFSWTCLIKDQPIKFKQGFFIETWVFRSLFLIKHNINIVSAIWWLQHLDRHYIDPFKLRSSSNQERPKRMCLCGGGWQCLTILNGRMFRFFDKLRKKKKISAYIRKMLDTKCKSNNSAGFDIFNWCCRILDISPCHIHQMR